jgi:hypothetical protein
MGAMKKLGMVLLLVVSAWAAKKPYEAVQVTATQTTVNANKVRFIEAEEMLPDGTPSYKAKHFTFTCNEDVASCPTPAIGELYTIETRGIAYKCDNYALCRKSPVAACIRVCLTDVY